MGTLKEESKQQHLESLQLRFNQPGDMTHNRFKYPKMFFASRVPNGMTFELKEN
jgi:hypothetical protein